MLVNNAGFGLIGRFAELDAKRLRQMIDLNVGTLTELCRSSLAGHDRAQVGRDPQRRLDRRLPARGRTWRSISRPRPMSCRFTEALHEELKPHGIKVIPRGAIRTARS
jgi:short-subunit dehydrogenase